MTDVQFAILIAVLLGGTVAVILTIPWAVERAVSVRMEALESMMGRALAHGGSIDTLARSVKLKVEAAEETSAKGLEVALKLKDRLDNHEARITRIEEHPVIRPLGGGK